MFLVLSKYLPLLLYPLGLSLLLVAGAAATLIRWRIWPFCILGACFLVLWIPSTPAFSEYLASSLEMQYAARPIDKYPQAGAIVVLSGAVSRTGPSAESIRPDDNYDRLHQGWKLFKAGKAEYIVTSGGKISWMTKKRARSGAVRMAELLRELGVPESRILSEGESRNTWENALNTSKLLQDRGVDKVLLCTSAMHLPRAKACFERAGIRAVPVPASYEVRFFKKSCLLDYLPHARALQVSTESCKEYLGLLYYWLRGWI